MQLASLSNHDDDEGNDPNKTRLKFNEENKNFWTNKRFEHHHKLISNGSLFYQKWSLRLRFRRKNP